MTKRDHREEVAETSQDNARKSRENQQLKANPEVKDAVETIEQPWLEVIDQRPNTAGPVNTQILREAATSNAFTPRVKVEAEKARHPVGTLRNRVRGMRAIVTCPCGQRPVTSDDDESPCEVCGRAVVRIVA